LDRRPDRGNAAAGLTTAGSADWYFAATSFTVEAWVRFNSFSASGTTYTIVGQWAANTLGWRVGRVNGRFGMHWATPNSGDSFASTLDAAFTPPLNQWCRVAVTRDFSTGYIRVFGDGALLLEYDASASTGTSDFSTAHGR
jgi:hypothetical protein